MAKYTALDDTLTLSTIANAASLFYNDIDPNISFETIVNISKNQLMFHRNELTDDSIIAYKAALLNPVVIKSKLILMYHANKVVHLTNRNIQKHEAILQAIG